MILLKKSLELLTKKSKWDLDFNKKMGNYSKGSFIYHDLACKKQ